MLTFVFFFFFKQKTAYEIYQCDWSSDVCSSDLEVRSSIIAGNFSTNDPVNPNSDVDSVAGNVTNSFVSLGYNVIGKGLPLALNAFNQLGDQTDIVDPGLAPLSLVNGGPTATHALLPTSPAINAGDPNAMAGVGNVPENDQRGTGFSDRKSVVEGKRVDLGGRRIIKKKRKESRDRKSKRRNSRV